MYSWGQSTDNISSSIQYPVTDKKHQSKERILAMRCGGGLLDTGNKKTLVEQFNRVLACGNRLRRKDLNGEYPIQGYKKTVSFSKAELDPDDPSSPEKALDIVDAAMKKTAKDRLYFMVAQADGKGGCLHVHVVECALHTESLKALRGRETNREYFKEHLEKAMEDREIYLDPGANHPKRGRSTGDHRKEYTKKRDGKSWMEELQERIKKAAAKTTSSAQFEEQLRLQGVLIARRNKSGLTYQLDECDDPRWKGKKARYDKFSEDFSAHTLNALFDDNYKALRAAEAQKAQELNEALEASQKRLSRLRELDTEFGDVLKKAAVKDKQGAKLID